MGRSPSLPGTISFLLSCCSRALRASEGSHQPHPETTIPLKGFGGAPSRHPRERVEGFVKKRSLAQLPGLKLERKLKSAGVQLLEGTRRTARNEKRARSRLHQVHRGLRKWRRQGRKEPQRRRRPPGALPPWERR